MNMLNKAYEKSSKLLSVIKTNSTNILSKAYAKTIEFAPSIIYIILFIVFGLVLPLLFLSYLYQMWLRKEITTGQALVLTGNTEVGAAMMVKEVYDEKNKNKTEKSGKF